MTVKSDVITEVMDIVSAQDVRHVTKAKIEQLRNEGMFVTVKNGIVRLYRERKKPSET